MRQKRFRLPMDELVILVVRKLIYHAENHGKPVDECIREFCKALQNYLGQYPEAPEHRRYEVELEAAVAFRSFQPFDRSDSLLAIAGDHMYQEADELGWPVSYCVNMFEDSLLTCLSSTKKMSIMDMSEEYIRRLRPMIA